jgi:hypothetical protein
VGRKIGLLLGTAACCTLVAACFGGSDDPTPSPTPTPTSSPTPTPTPTPTATPTPVAYSFTSAFTDTSTNTSYSFAYFSAPGVAETWSDGARLNGASTIKYEVAPESVTFTWPDNSSLAVLFGADRQTSTPTLRTYRNGTNAISLELPFVEVLRVTYERVDPFTRDAVAGFLRSNRVALFFNRVTTTAAIAADIFYTGTAQVAGGTPKTSAPGIFSAAPTTLTVAASDKKVTGTIQIIENVGGTPTVRANLPISATLGTGETFTGATEDTASGFKGSFSGILAGANREEVAMIFTVTHTDGRKLIGSLIGS